jgi:hypothetical protein
MPPLAAANRALGELRQSNAIFANWSRPAIQILLLEEYFAVRKAERGKSENHSIGAE